MIARTLIVLVGAAIAAGCGQAAATVDRPPSSSTPAPNPRPSVPPAASCMARGILPAVLPDAACTPGALNMAVTTSTLGTTICKRGWTATVRPPQSYTDALKPRLMVSYGDTLPKSAYELDHLVPLELGGDPWAVENLWPEPDDNPRPRVLNSKDLVENALKAKVCSHQMTLPDAQHAIATDWVAVAHQLGIL